MTPGARLQAVLELLDLIETTATLPANQILLSFFRQRRYIGSRDRTHISQRVYSVLRTYAHLNEAALLQGIRLDKLALEQAQRLRLIFYLAWKEQCSLQQISSWFNGEQYNPSPLTDLETRFLTAPFPDEKHLSLEIQGEIPKPLLPFFEAAFPQDLLLEAKALQQEAPVDLRVNTLKSPVCDVQHLLELEGIFTEKMPFSPIGLRLKTRVPLSGLKIFQEGLFEIQDEGSQLISLLTGALPGERIMDFCAGAGGKTLALAASMKNKGHIFACDTAPWRLKRAQERLRRAGVHNVATHPLESHLDPWLKRHREKMDRVLIDAPCSGTGTWRRHPEQRWRLRPEDVRRLTTLQQEILESAARLVRPGGILVYATCSLFECENQEQIRIFLSHFSDFSLIPVASLWPASCGAPFPCQDPDVLFLTPHRHNTDGFFCAILQKAS